jgi:membrane protein YqaA with SNARE-associated domain
MSSPLRRLYNWTLHIAAHRHAVAWLAGIAFIESSVFPIPPDVALMPMCLAQRRKSFFYAAVCAASSVAGGLLGYAIGHFLFDAVGRPVLEFYGLTESFARFQETYNKWGLWVILGAGVVPFPFKIITIMSGVTGMSLPLFLAASAFARTVRFTLVAGLVWKFGAPLQAFIEKYLEKLTAAAVLLLIAAVVAVKYAS